MDKLILKFIWKCKGLRISKAIPLAIGPRGEGPVFLAIHRSSIIPTHFISSDSYRYPSSPWDTSFQKTHV